MPQMADALAKVLVKLEASVAENKFYEALQMYKSVARRYAQMIPA